MAAMRTGIALHASRAAARLRGVPEFMARAVPSFTRAPQTRPDSARLPAAAHAEQESSTIGDVPVSDPGRRSPPRPAAGARSVSSGQRTRPGRANPPVVYEACAESDSIRRGRGGRRYFCLPVRIRTLTSSRSLCPADASASATRLPPTSGRSGSARTVTRRRAGSRDAPGLPRRRPPRFGQAVLMC